MKLTSKKILALAVVLMFAAAPVMAEEHNTTETDDTDSPEDDSDMEENETEDDSDIEGTDNSTELTVTKEEAQETAVNALSDNNWTLERSSTHEDDGYYRFRFVISGMDAEAEVRVDGSSGEVFELEEEIESEDNRTREEHRERAEEFREEHRQRAIEARIDAKQRQIDHYQDRIEELREEIEALRNGNLTPEKDKRDTRADRELELKKDGNRTRVKVRDGDRKAEVEVDGNETEVEAEGPSNEARENVEGTPGNEKARQKRPNFVNRMLGGLFG